MKIPKHLRVAVLASASLFAIANTSYGDDVIDEIIVTADYLDRSVNELPASLTLLDARELDALAVQHFEELVNVVPNLNWSGDGHRARYFQIRGIGERSQYEGAPNPSVGFIIDDIDFSGIGTIATLYDVDRIEVLRGPQAIRYGANALAGLIYVQSRQPSADSSGSLKFGIGSDNAMTIGGAVGGSLTDDARTTARVSAHYHESDGFRDNPFLRRSDTNGRQESMLRAKLRHAFSDDVDLAVALLYANIDNGYDAFAIDNSYTVLSDKPGRDSQESFGASAKFEWSVSDALSFTSISAVANSAIDFSFDADWGNDQSWAPFTYDFESVSDRQRDTASQEFRLASGTEDGSQWLVGLYALRLTEDLATLSFGDYVDPGVFAGNFDAPPFDSAYEATSVAAFGQFVRPVAASTELDVGLRFERRRVDYLDSNAIAASPSETMNGGHVALTHAFSDTVSGFVGVAKGYKAGGFNLGVVPQGRRNFEREELWSYEAGLRSRWLNDRLAVNATVFFADRSDQQVGTSFQIDPNDPVSFVFFTDNATGSKSRGLEANVQWQVNEFWQWYANIGLLDTKFDEFVTADVDNTGRELAHAPSYTLATGVAWQSPAGWFARLDLTARDKFYFSDSHDQQSKAYALANGKFGYTAERWQAEVWIRNIFDRDYAVRGFFFGNEPPNFPDTLYTRLGDPRQAGLTLDWRF